MAALLGLSCLLAAGAGASGDASSASCPAGTEASPGFRPYLPDCRAYELVPPTFKNSSVLETQPAAISADGERVLAGLPGAFAGAGNAWLQLNRNPDVSVYEFVRAAGGWQPHALTPPAASYPSGGIMAASPTDDLRSTLWGLSTTPAVFSEDVYLREPDGTFVEVGPGVVPQLRGTEHGPLDELSFVGSSQDLTRSVYTIQSNVPEGQSSDLWPGDATVAGARSLYEYVYAGRPNPEPSLVAVRDAGQVANQEAHLISRCGAELGSSESLDTYNAVSSDGQTVLFTAHACHLEAGEPPVNELYARVDGTRTVDVSEPSQLDCASCNTTANLANAEFRGASADGEKVFFTTEQELLPGQRGMNLYEYDFAGADATPEHPAGRISLVSRGASEPDVQGVVRVSENGQRVYFVARGVLSGANEEGEQPEAGADNLYVLDTTTGESPRFVAKLLTPGEEARLEAEEAEEERTVSALAEARALRAAEEALSRGVSFEEALAVLAEVSERERRELSGALGPAGTLAEDRSAWAAEDSRPVQATDDGRYLVFTSSATLTADDRSSVPQLFEYDAVAQSLTRISIGEGASYANDGNVDVFRDSPHIPAPFHKKVERPSAAGFGVALTADGSSVFFTSVARLSPLSAAGATNLYEYRDGALYLISDGSDSSTNAGSPTVRLFGLGAGARDVFFTTADPLVPQVGDTQESLYDAREGGGFPGPPVLLGCAGEACRGANAQSPALLAPGSATQPPEAAAANRDQAARPATDRLRRAARAMARCRRMHSRRRRARCEADTRKRYGIKSRRLPSAHRPAPGGAGR